MELINIDESKDYYLVACDGVQDENRDVATAHDVDGDDNTIMNDSTVM